MENTIKSIMQTACPHCKKDFYVEFEMHPTTLSQVFTSEQVADAKAVVLREIKESAVDDLRKENLINWVTDAATIFGPGEVPLITESLTAEEGK